MGVILAGLLALAAAGLFSERLILRPGAALMEASRRLAAGDLSARAAVPRGTGEMHELARAFNEMAASLEQRSRERNLAYQQLKDAQVQLIQTERLASVGQLSAGIAHELKNPLAIILQGAEFLEQDSQAGAAQRAEVLAMTKKAVVRADTIIRNLLIFTRQTPAQRQSVNLHDVIATSLVLVHKPLMMSRVTVARDLQAEPALVPADPNQMEQIFINLIMNALQAMPQGGRLTLATRRQILATLGHGVGRRAEDFFTVGQEALICEVTDTGTGIAEEDLNKVFDPFFTTKPPGEGTGLGLSTVQSIVDAHRGLINMESQAGRGTTVRMTFPVAA